MIFASRRRRRSVDSTSWPPEDRLRAVLCDLDGTLIVDRSLSGNTDMVRPMPGVVKNIAKLRSRGLAIGLVTNQSGVARGYYPESTVHAVHAKLEHLLSKQGVKLSGIYYCPHHPERGFAGERADLKIECACRKPKPGLVEQAVRDLNLDLTASWLIGDSTTDIETARNAGLKSILVRTGYAGADGRYSSKPDFIFDNLNQAVHFILEQQHAKA
jgi:histidinol-phosphate phosphatase family protein